MNVAVKMFSLNTLKKNLVINFEIKQRNESLSGSTVFTQLVKIAAETLTS